MKRYLLTRTAVMRTKTDDWVYWATGSTVWSTGEVDLTLNHSIEVVPYPGSEFKVWMDPDDLEDA